MLAFLLKLKLKSKDNKTYKRQSKKKERKNFKFFTKTSSLLLQLQNLILRLSLLDIRLFKVTSLTKSHILIIEIAKIFSKTIIIFILTNKNNNAINCLCVKISINL